MTVRVGTGRLTPMPFFRRRWEEVRGDEHDEWGPATYYFWVLDGQDSVEAQIEVYDAGVVLAYDRYHVEDEYGGRTSETLDPAEWSQYEIDQPTFAKEALDGPRPFNRQG